MADDIAVDEVVLDVVALLEYYGFELNAESPATVVLGWQQLYPASWLRTAVIEALYRGRYKQVSVEEILRSWQKWNKIRQNFDAEFEQLICSKIQSELVVVPPESQEIHRDTDDTAEKLEENEEKQELKEIVSVAVPETYQKLKAIAADPTPLSDDQEEE